jgi:hypothetical protein
VIASGDSDFCPLAGKLRENDRTVIGLAVKQATSPMFVKACDEFIYLKPEGREGREARESAPRSSHARERTPREDHGSKKPREVPAIAREVVQSLLSRATGPFIKETLVRKEPDFDERDHGFSTFSRMLESLEKEGMLKRQQLGRQWYVLSPDAPAMNNAPAPVNAPPEDGGGEEAIPDPD